jgi:hypothetical protein
VVARALSLWQLYSDIKLSIITRQERERLVLDLYRQGKTYREISKVARISPRDIGAILNKVLEEKTQGKEEQGDAEKNQEQQHNMSISSKAYKLFSNRNTPLEVAIALNLRESEATKFYRVLEAKTTTQSYFDL